MSFSAQITRRDFEGKQTLGKMRVLDVCNNICFECHTLELPWRDNKFQVSCIPLGDYWVEKRWSQKFKHHFIVKDVEGRTYILIHSGNFYEDTLGCVLVGDGLTDIDGDGLRDVTNSRETLDELLSFMPDKFKLTIKED